MKVPGWQLISLIFLIMASLRPKQREHLRVLAKRLRSGSLQSIEHWKKLTTGLREQERSFRSAANVAFFSEDYRQQLTMNIFQDIGQEASKAPKFCEDVSNLSREDQKDLYLTVLLLYREQGNSRIDGDDKSLGNYRVLLKVLRL